MKVAPYIPFSDPCKVKFNPQISAFSAAADKVPR